MIYWRHWWDTGMSFALRLKKHWSLKSGPFRGRTVLELSLFIHRSQAAEPVQLEERSSVHHHVFEASCWAVSFGTSTFSHLTLTLMRIHTAPGIVVFVSDRRFCEEAQGHRVGYRPRACICFVFRSVEELARYDVWSKKLHGYHTSIT